MDFCVNYHSHAGDCCFFFLKVTFSSRGVQCAIISVSMNVVYHNIPSVTKGAEFETEIGLKVITEEYYWDDNVDVINSPRLGRLREFMLSTVLDCRQSLSEFSFCFFSTWLRGRWLGCTALFAIPKILTNFTLTYRKALITMR